MARNRRARRTLTTLLVLVLISVSVITLDQRATTHHLTSGLRSVASTVFSPFRTAANDLLRPVGNAFSGVLHYGSLQSENEKLQQTISQLQLSQREQASEQARLQQIRNLSNLLGLPSLVDIPKVTAQVIDVNPSNFDADVTISKGRNQGVIVGLPVVGNGGLVGQVVQAFHDTAVVQLLTDGQSSVGVTVGSGPLAPTGFVNGQGPDAGLSVASVPTTDAVRNGEQLFTDGLQGAEFPPGLPVATITSHHSQVGANQATIVAAPRADLNNLSVVGVLLWQPPA